MRVLGIETTCDETAFAIVEDGETILSSRIASQVDLHQAYGGVVPELSCRRHIDLIPLLLIETLKESGIDLNQIDRIAVAHGPGLVGALLIGVMAAKTLAIMLKKPLVGVNHVEAHLYAASMGKKPPMPALGVVISGGHTSLLRMESAYGPYEVIGQTADDALGEAFDKVARVLGLPYPGGPVIEEMAKSGDSTRFPFKAGVVKGRPFDFSFSGLKTNVLYAVKGQNGVMGGEDRLCTSDKINIAASFQETALGDIVRKAVLAANEYECQSILFGGGVSCNKRLREKMTQATSLPLYFPENGLSLDNAAMIAGLGYHLALSQTHELHPCPRMSFRQTRQNLISG